MIQANLQHDVVRVVESFSQLFKDDRNHRFRSWEHCYDYFGQEEIDVDKACLHMAFYLASWGMYRGSSFLFWKDYLIHKDIVIHLIKLRHLRKLNADFSEIEIQEILDLSIWIKKWFKENIGKVNGEVREANATDTLVTKILLGTLGCVPAYDRFFIDGLQEKKTNPYKPSLDGVTKVGITNLVRFYKNHSRQFDTLKSHKTVGGNSYPAMKLVDMYFWQVGYELDQERKRKAKK